MEHDRQTVELWSVTPPRSTAVALLARKHVLLDFDGPITHMFAQTSSTIVADRMRGALPSWVDLPPSLRETADPLIILRWARANLSDTHAEPIEHACIQGEVDAVKQSTPTPGAIQLLTNLAKRRQPVAIVSNNAATAIGEFLDIHQLGHLITTTIGRTFGHPETMKPHPDALTAALGLLGAPRETALFIGDSVTDVQAARTTGIPCLGYAKTPQRGQELRTAGATAIFATMSELADITT